MVMPDRMRWIYRDPQGNIQGPWTGLEMHDWFKAGFFSPDLQIKKVEEQDFEPLAHLVRRIGNSREPFLVPQIGIPHGPDPASSAWAGSSSGAAQPPFPGSFPSFGTTLTAEQQNALERRKQEEQYLMARQKEHLAQQQALMKQMQLQGLPQPMNAPPPHSLQSQPSLGSIASPVGYQQSPVQAPGQQQSSVPFMDTSSSMRQNALSGAVPQVGADLTGPSQDQLPALLERLNVGRADPFSFGSPGSSPFAGRQAESTANLLHTQQQVASVLQERVRLQKEQEQYDDANADSLFDQQAREERLRQFHALRMQEGDFGLRTAEGLPTHPPAHAGGESEIASSEERATPQSAGTENEPALTLSQQVKKAATAQRQQQQEVEKQQKQQQQKDARSEVISASKIAPPPSASPLPAPAAQRNRQNVAESLAAGSRSRTQTPTETTQATSIAPWAKDATEIPKGPSLKEIQEAEARSAAQKEEIAAAARRANVLAEQERISQAQAQMVSPGLPSTANWASTSNTSSPAPAAVTSVWGQTTVPGAGGTSKKTLAQIQKEEEIRKQRLAAVAASAGAIGPQNNNGATAPAAAASVAAAPVKRYADLASKAPPSTANSSGSSWTTVGAGGKAKAPPPTTPSGPRSSISGNVPTISPPVARAKPTATAGVPRAATVASVGNTGVVASPTTTNANKALEEFTKWAKLTLGKGLNNGISGMFPINSSICSVYVCVLDVLTSLV